MTSDAAKGTLLTSQAAEQQESVEVLQADAAADEAEASVLEAEAAALEEQSAQDNAAAATDEATAVELSAAAAEQEEQVVAHTAKAAAEDALAKEEMAAGTEMGELAVSNSLKAHADEVGIGICQIIPGVDVVCDFVGGLAATAWETTAAAEAAEATADFVAAAATREQEEADAALAAELQVQVEAEEAKAAQAQEESVALTEKSQAEHAEAQAEEAAAEEERAKGVAEEEAAEAAEVEVAEEEEQAGQAFASSARHGIQAVAYMVAQMGLSLFLVFVFTSRLVIGTLVPSFFSAASALATTSSTTAISAGGLLTHYVFSMSTVVLSFAICSVVAISYTVILTQPNVTSRGGAILEISLFALVAQVLLLYAVHLIYYESSSGGNGSRKLGWIRRTVYFLLDLILVFAWNAFAVFLLSPYFESIPVRAVYYIGPTVLVVVAIHHCYFYRRKINSQQRDLPNDTVSEDVESNLDSNEVDDYPHERTSLLSSDKEGSTPGELGEAPIGWVRERHQLLFEVLLSSCMVALACSCLSRSSVLNPFWSPARDVLMEAVCVNKWLLLWIGLVVLGVSSIAFGLHVYWRRRRLRRQT